MRYSMVQPGCEPVLSGAINGKTAFADMVKAIGREPPVPTALYLDFLEVSVATASYLRESAFALKAYLRNINSNYYPVVSNVNDSVHDELLTIANARSDAIVACLISEKGIVSGISLIGHLEQKQQLTFDLVSNLKQADASQLMQEHGEGERLTSTTAWNNRLAGLVSRGLIREFTRGRAKFYRPILEASE